MRMYWRQGMKKGLSPENYIKKLTDMTEKGKQLNWIKVILQNFANFCLHENYRPPKARKKNGTGFIMLIFPGGT